MPGFEGSGLGNEDPGQGSEGQAIVWKAEGWRMKHADQLEVDWVELMKVVVIAMCLLSPVSGCRRTHIHSQMMYGNVVPPVLLFGPDHFE